MKLTSSFTDRGRAALMVLHEPEIAALYCSRLLMLRDGAILLDAPTKEAFKMLGEMGELDYIPEAAANADGP
jgi:ABC-type cobalamin/Fe3+-siderophores transport system ATPase subunit